MNESRGQLLLASPPEKRIEIHQSAWPSAEIDYQRIVGMVIARILKGDSAVLDQPPPEDGPSRVTIDGLSVSDLATLDSKLPPPPTERDKPASSSFHRWAIELPRATQTDPRNSEGTASRFPGWIEVVDGSSVLLVSVVSPIMNELATVFRIRSGQGPKTLTGAKKAIERSVEAHQMLGLDWRPIRTLIEPSLDAEAVISARRQLVESWSNFPSDIGERSLALLCFRLAERYYGKARKDGRANRAQVITAKTQPLLGATLGSWDNLLEYLEEAASDADAVRTEPIVSKNPAGRPAEIDQRLQVVRRWFLDVFDPAHSTQEPGSLSLWGLVPETHVSYLEDDQSPLRGERNSSTPTDAVEASPSALETEAGTSIDPVDKRTELDVLDGAGGNNSNRASAYDPNLWLTQLSPEMVDSIWDLWGTTVLARFPDVLVEDLHPETSFAGILQPAARVWEDLALTCWFLCFGPYSRTTLDGLEDRLSQSLDELSDLGCPVDRSVFSQLIEAGEGNDWLFRQELSISLTISIDEFGELVDDLDGVADDKPNAEDVFLTLRDIITWHRKTWLEDHLDAYLEGRWKRDLEKTSVSYQEFEAGRGKPPTVKQAYPKLEKAAKAWFGGDLSRTAVVLDIAGPVAEIEVTRSERKLPGDLRKVRVRVNELLGGGLDGEGDEHWPKRRRFELSRQVEPVLTVWQASGELPSRPAFGKNWLLKEAFPDNFEAGYLEYIGAVRQALTEVGHSAAEAPLAK